MSAIIASLKCWSLGCIYYNAAEPRVWRRTSDSRTCHV